MKMSPKVGNVLALAMLLLTYTAIGASFSLSPSSISNLYSGNLTLQITGLTNGETVVVERFLDLNANGIIDTTDPLVQSFRLTDGQATSVGGVRNGNVPGDNDSALNGQINSTINFPYGPEFSRAAGAQIFRVSSPVGHFSPAQQTLAVAQSPYPQQITGTVTTNGAPAAYALVGILAFIGTDLEFVAGTVANSTGNFSLNVSNGTYQTIAFKPGYVGSFVTSPQVVISGGNTNVSVPLTKANLVISGNVTETAAGTAIPGFQFFATSTNNEYSALFSDAAGNFSVSVSTGQWKLDPSDGAVMLNGYLRAQQKVKVNVAGGNVSGVNIQFTRGTGLIYGTVKDDLNTPLQGVRLFGNDSANLFEAAAITDMGGNYFLAANNDQWNLGPDNNNPGLPYGYTLQQVQVPVANGQAVQTNLVARHASAHLIGHARDGNGGPITMGSMSAYGINNLNANAHLLGDGGFDLPVSGGSWTISLDSQTAASLNLVAPQLTFNVIDGVNISNINYVAPFSTRQISGSVKTASNTPIANLNVFAGAVINGTNYGANANTDAGGNYLLPVIPGSWDVGLDQQGLAQRGFGMVFDQNANTSNANQTVNFIVGSPPVGFITFRHNLGVVGEFAGSHTPSVTYPVPIRNYRVIFRVLNDTNPPAASTVLFTGPPGSGMTNSPADSSLGAMQDGTNVVYLSTPVKNPPIALGGNWTVIYRTNANNFNMPDPQAMARGVVPLPTVTLSNGFLRSINWNYKDRNGNPIAGTPFFLVSSRIDLFDQNGNGLDVEVFPAAMSYTYPATNTYSWSNIGLLRMDYYDTFTNQYFVGFTESAPTLTGGARLTGQRFQFLLNGPAGQNFTIQYSTNLALTNWSTLLLTNPSASPVVIVDPAATNLSRYYRALVGP